MIRILCTPVAVLSLLMLPVSLSSQAAEPASRTSAPKYGVKTRGVASARPAASPAVADIALSIFSQKLGKVIPFTSASRDPYGMNMDVLAVVKITGDIQYSSPAKLNLRISAGAESSEAAGDQAAWSISLSRDLYASSETGVTYVPFLFPYECRGKVTLTAEFEGAKPGTAKSVSRQFACAE